jgi:uncharacterized protein YxeA
MIYRMYVLITAIIVIPVVVAMYILSKIETEKFDPTDKTQYNFNRVDI